MADRRPAVPKPIRRDVSSGNSSRRVAFASSSSLALIRSTKSMTYEDVVLLGSWLAHARARLGRSVDIAMRSNCNQNEKPNARRETDTSSHYYQRTANMFKLKMSCCVIVMCHKFCWNFGRVGLAVFSLADTSLDFRFILGASHDDMRRFAASPSKVPALGRHPNDAEVFIDDGNLCCRLLQSVCGGGTLTVTKQTNDD